MSFESNPRDIVSSWIALEALSPQTFTKPEELANNDQSCVVKIDENNLPWHGDQKSRKNYQLYYLVVLGSISLKPATKALIKAFGEDEEASLRVNGQAMIAAVMVDKKGCILQEKSIGISSFAWALPQVLEKNLRQLSNWADVEQKTTETVFELLNRVDDDGNKIPLNYSMIEAAWQLLIDRFKLPTDLDPELVKKPQHIIKVYHYYKSPTEPEPPLLNSFYLNDLALIETQFKQDNLPIGLEYYLGIRQYEEKKDILADKRVLEETLAPHYLNAARWPGEGGHPLVTLQQAAVNMIRDQLSGSAGIVAVNGPPGTGKTTLLRDVIVAAVLDRATAMVKFSNPSEALTTTGMKRPAGNGFFHLYALPESLKGHEIIVASSNNKAVENVSKELPALKAIDASYEEELRYFKMISDGLFNTPEKESEDVDAKIETWGLIAAILGNASNRSAFQNMFWWDTDYSFRVYLNAARGKDVTIEEVDANDKKIRRQPEVVIHEAPPLSADQALREWKKAQKEFLQRRKEVEAELKKISVIRKKWHALLEVHHQIQEQNGVIKELLGVCKIVDTDLENCQKQVAESELKVDEVNVSLQNHKAQQPGFFSRLFRTERWSHWSEKNQGLEKQKGALKNTLRNDKSKELKAIEQKRDLELQLEKENTLLSNLTHDKEALDVIMEKAKLIYGSRLVDDEYLFAEHDVLHKNSPWATDALHKKREALFVSALKVQRTFIGAAAQKFHHNLNFLIALLSNGLPKEYDAYLRDIWATLFSVVPVVSTTFASVQTMLGRLPKESIGWLLIDEAGQAVPQAAAGAIFRSQKVVVVGDPLQIPPVVSLPQALNREICNYFKIDELMWTAPTGSAQSLADRASLYQSQLEEGDDGGSVGLPLLVHRRCQNPMFKISNDVAYSGQMVHAVPQKALDSVALLLGKSCWFNVDGEADTKWCPDEGILVLSLLKKLANTLTKPNLFIITPFRDVAYHLRNMLKAEKELFSKFGITDEKQQLKWLSDNIGTVHTFQGREAETVLFVLGAPNNRQNGSRKWAAGTPNIINVAVSRAKNNLYVIGSYGAWSGVGYARDLANQLLLINQGDLNVAHTPNNNSIKRANSDQEKNDSNINITSEVKSSLGHGGDLAPSIEEPTNESVTNELIINKTMADEENLDDASLAQANEPVTKKCGQCGEVLSSDHFHPTTKYADGLSKWCKDCIDDFKDIKAKPTGLKLCSKCNKNRRKSSFFKSQKTEDRLSKWCKFCHEVLAKNR